MKCDFHVHTHYSYDSTSSVQAIVKIAVRKKINCLAITDHDEVRGVLEIEKYAAKESILIIPGIEVKTKMGDILGLNVKTKISDGLSVKDTIQKIKEQGGIAIIAHPFSSFTPFEGRIEEFLEEIDGIEVLNASIFQRDNKKALKVAKKERLSFTAGSDAHSPEFIGRAYMEIPGNNLSVEQVLRSMMDKNGQLCGKEISFFEKIIDHSQRTITKLKKLKNLKNIC